MNNPPKTKAEAKKTTYGHHNRQRYTPAQCAYEAADRSNSRWVTYHQCSRKPGHGPDRLYCKTHALQVSDEEFDAYYVNLTFTPEIRIRKAKKFTDTRVYYDRTYSQLKEANGSKWFKTEDEAVAYFTKNVQSRIDSLWNRIKGLEEDLKNPPIKRSDW